MGLARIERGRTGRPRLTFYIGFALATAAATYVGFGFTYFLPRLHGTAEPIAPLVHLHGWAFFLWYLLFPLQAGLIAADRARLHMALGRLSVGLALIMVTTGLMVLSVRLHVAMNGGDAFIDRFFLEMGTLILSNLLLFAMLYVLAIRAAIGGRFDVHKRLMVLASAAALGAALWRVLMFTVGPGPGIDFGGILLTNVFMIAALAIDRLREGRFHPAYTRGLALVMAVEAILWPWPGNPVVALVNAGLDRLGALVMPIY